MKAILITKDSDVSKVALTEVDVTQLPEGNVEIAVEYSTLNYKDSLAITGSSPVVRSFPMVPGIDLLARSPPARTLIIKPATKSF